MRDIDPALFPIEDRGYGRGVGHLVLPSGQLLAVQHEQDELANVLSRAVFAEWSAKGDEPMTAEGPKDPPPPPEPGETSTLRAKDLKNRVVVLRPFDVGIDESKPDKSGRPWEWTLCECWVIDGTDVPEAYEPALRVSWWRVREQLGRVMNEYVVGRLREEDDRSVVLVPLEDGKRSAVDRVWPQIRAQEAPQVPPVAVGASDEYGYEEPF